MAAARGPPAQSAYLLASGQEEAFMADLGKPIRVIEVHPLEHPVPREAPADPAPVETPDKVPVKAP